MNTNTPTQENPTMSTSSAISAVCFSDLPAAGEAFPGQGGTLVGVILGRKGEPSFALIRATDPTGNFNGVELGTYGAEVENANSFIDGAANTKALAAAGSELCQRIQQLEIDGHKDWYLPAAREAQLANVHIADQLEHDDYYITSTQRGARNVRVQDFEYGGSDFGRKDYSGRAVAFRKIQLSNSVPQ